MPDEKNIEISDNETLLQALVRNGYNIRSSCGGVASCGDCVVKVLRGMESLSSPDFPEIKLLGNVFHITSERLSCQTKVNDDVSIDISHHSTPVKKKKKVVLRRKKPVEEEKAMEEKPPKQGGRYRPKRKK